MIKKIEILANVAIIIASVVLCSVVAKKYVFSTAGWDGASEAFGLKSPGLNRKQREPIQAGTRLSLLGVDWSKSNRTLLLALSTTCHFCTESAPFYQRLERERNNNVRLIAVLPQPVDDGRTYLKKLGVSFNNVVQASLGSVGVSGTPTLILIDNSGKVTDSWVGKLSDDEAAKVISRMAEN